MARATLEDAEAITDADLDTLDGLARKHLLLHSRGPNGEDRLAMLETVREYAGELLDAAGHENETRARGTADGISISRHGPSGTSSRIANPSG
jgi:hypothetical protein